MTSEELCQEFNILTGAFKDCFVTSDEGEHPAKELTDRLLRHYVSEEVVSKPEKAGSENRFGFQHLMELLAVRMLQAERALTLIGMRGLVCGKNQEYLYLLLTHGAKLEVGANETSTDKPRGNPQALQAIDEIKHSTLKSQQARNEPADHLPGLAAEHGIQWKAHHLLATGLELAISEDFREPTSPREERRLMDAFRSCLREQRRRRPEG
jgi:hypothetical protein